MVKIRLARRGRRKMAMYDVVVADARAPRDGKFIEKLGTYNPHTDPASTVLDNERALYWLGVGAQPTETTRSILSKEGILLKFHLSIKLRKGLITQEQADLRYNQWETQKQEKLKAYFDKLHTKKSEVLKTLLEGEIKVREARAEVIRKKQEALQQSAVAAAQEAATETAEAE